MPSEMQPTIKVETMNPAMSAVIARRVQNSGGKWLLTIDDELPMVCGEGLTSPQLVIEHANKFFHLKSQTQVPGDIKRQIEENAALASIFWAMIETGIHPSIAWQASKRALQNFDRNGVVILP